MTTRQGKGNSLSKNESGTPLLRIRREAAKRGVEWAITNIERREARGSKLPLTVELSLMATGFVLGARQSKDGRLTPAEATRYANELIDTGTVAELGVQLWVRMVDGVTGANDGGWAVGFASDAAEETPRPQVIL